MNADHSMEKAIRYVGSEGSHDTSGAFQFQNLKEHGMTPKSRVLEIGAGCLLLGHHLIDYLDEFNYTAIEPSGWLINAGHDFFGGTKLFGHVAATDFDAHDGQFDIIYSHSILSHASRHQLPEYLAACKRQLRPGGLALASIRFNLSPDGGIYCPSNSNDEEWVYPGIAWFTRETAFAAAEQCGFAIRERQDIRAGFMAATNGDHHHDWIELRHQETPA